MQPVAVIVIHAVLTDKAQHIDAATIPGLQRRYSLLRRIKLLRGYILWQVAGHTQFALYVAGHTNQPIITVLLIDEQLHQGGAQNRVCQFIINFFDLIIVRAHSQNNIRITILQQLLVLFLRLYRYNLVFYPHILGNEFKNIRQYTMGLTVSIKPGIGLGIRHKRYLIHPVRAAQFAQETQPFRRYGHHAPHDIGIVTISQGVHPARFRKIHFGLGLVYPVNNPGLIRPCQTIQGLGITHLQNFFPVDNAFTAGDNPIDFTTFQRRHLQRHG